MPLLRVAAVSRLLALLCCLGAVCVQAAGPGEYQVKAVFLFNFSQFVEWPAAALGPPDTPFSICILGEDRFGSELDATVRGESVQGHRFAVRRLRNVAELDSSCRILFIDDSASVQLGSIVGTLGERAILTVSDIDRSAEQGAIIQFATERNRLRLRINIAAARTAGLVLSSKLLRPAEIVGSEAHE